MSLRLVGDVSAEQKELAKQLTEYEQTINGEHLIPAERRAQMYVCLAHDWYQLDMEEEGNRLLIKAEQVYPGYFKNIMLKHTEESKEFDMVARNLTVELAWMLVNRINERVT